MEVAGWVEAKRSGGVDLVLADVVAAVVVEEKEDAGVGADVDRGYAGFESVVDVRIDVGKAVVVVFSLLFLLPL